LSNIEKVPSRMKPQDPPSTTEAGRAQSTSIIQPSKSTALILTVAGLRNIGTRISGLRNLSTGTKPSTPENIIITREEVTRAGDEVVGEVKTNHYIACITKEI
jgi:hypothetical protein